MSYHTIIIVGRLGRDPELRYTASGQAVCNFPVATDYTYTNRDGSRVSETTWFRVSVWGKQAETTNQYLQKGRQVLVEGRLRGDENGSPRVWTRQDGTPAASFEITANTIRFLGSRGDNDSGQSSSSGSGNGDFFDMGDLGEQDDFGGIQF
ncbi:MAG: single-stranded DNA-binding protein [Anaerolineaceae bacterium]|nr:single-stranded DNA-binding protein [Anaerolineaceae bacterium]